MDLARQHENCDMTVTAIQILDGMLDTVPKSLERRLEKMVGWLIGFHGILTFVGYLMPNPFLYK